ncbi:MAG: division/cell wall cluster transcriptional repressor MraZ [Candidatus Curtissbacteria bacterium]|nr:division/cell wall cluster transcriptional repressor MraZ [Candidatus Curtissbacteria bacterium]
MFLGSYEPSFDENSRRLALPKKIRAYLATSEIILSYGFEKCIFGFDTKSWETESQKQLTGSLTDRTARNTRRFFFSSAERITLDAQGRIVIPGDLLNWAKVKKPVVIGAGDHFEIWDSATWQEEKLKISQ